MDNQQSKTNNLAASLDLTQERLDQLKVIFPDAFSEGKIDFNRLKAALGNDTVQTSERYELSWAGKSEARREIQKRTTATLRPDVANSVNWDATQNLYIEGENLEVLRTLQKAYFGKVKMIYIDPPYNTGSDSFVFPDDYTERLAEYRARTGLTDEAGFINKQDMWKKNVKENGQFHSVWLSMMYPRLFLARNLLCEDGVIFVSIDDNEAADLKLLMDEIFGEENFIESISWNKRIPKNDKGIGNIHEFILIYRKNSKIKHEFKMSKDGLSEVFQLVEKLKNKKLPLNEAEEEIKKLYEKRQFDRGITLYNNLTSDYRLFGKINMSWPNAETFGPTYEILHPITNKAVKIPDRGWRWIKETFDDAAGIVNGKYTDVVIRHDGSVICKKIWFAKDENTQTSSITYLDEVESLLLRSILSMKSDGGVEVEKLFSGKSYFSYPKPSTLIKTLLSSLVCQNNDVVMDFFSGSGTTAQAVLELNEEDGGNRQFICVQMPEVLDADSEAFKAGYKTIADIGRARIQKVIARMEAKRLEVSKQGKLENDAQPKQALGFNAFKLGTSNFKEWRTDLENATDLLAQMEYHVDSTKPDSEAGSMVYELLLKMALPITTPLTCQTVKRAGDEVQQIYIATPADSKPVAMFFGEVSPEITAFILELKPSKVLCLNKAFADSQALTNFSLQLKDAGIEREVL